MDYIGNILDNVINKSAEDSILSAFGTTSKQTKWEDSSASMADIMDAMCKIKNLPTQHSNLRVIEDSNMVEDGEPFEVNRTWRERILSFPWRPFKSTKTFTPKVPMRKAYMFDGNVVMHPAMVAEYLKAQSTS